MDYLIFLKENCNIIQLKDLLRRYKCNVLLVFNTISNIYKWLQYLHGVYNIFFFLNYFNKNVNIIAGANNKSKISCITF